jgi:hypothetical protein
VWPRRILWRNMNHPRTVRGGTLHMTTACRHSHPLALRATRAGRIGIAWAAPAGVDSGSTGEFRAMRGVLPK